ncbi:DivIVA domain-containing protein [Fructobacillus ficulneus]|uniref:Cell division initiation protein n=1 Tax=Fructobacillus ficulneus TaxID=157463 RepID=A0A0K8MI25_9LACO|nr:DivIVA domain-containing protein [Fructobacillus ficulneus]GAP00098.1 hypothetical protein FFIC_281040 [Fructobacillus ficulneus]
MALTPDEILNHEFTRKGSRAYVAREVDSFLDDVNNDYRNLLTEFDQLQQKNRQQKNRIEELEGQREQVNESIMFAQSAASRLRSETEAEVKAQLSHAQDQARQIVDDARRKAEAESARLAQENVDLINEQNRLRQKVDNFRQSFISIIDQQKTLLEQEQLSQAVEKLPMSELSDEVLADTISWPDAETIGATPVTPTPELAPVADVAEEQPLPTDLKEVPNFAKGPIESKEEAPVDPTVVVFPDNEQENK